MGSIETLQFLIRIIVSTFLVPFVVTQECKHPLPFLEKTASGIDITKFDFYPIDPSTSNLNGLVDNVFAYTCNGGKWHDKYSNDSIEYDVPDEFVNWPGISTGWDNWKYNDSTHGTHGHETFYSIDRTMLEVKKSGVEKIWPFTFSSTKDSQIKRLFTQNRKYQSLLKQYYGSDKVFATIANGTRCYKIEPKLKERTLSKEFVEFISKKLPPKYEDNPALYRQFVQRFGTHFFHYGFFGFDHYLQVALNRQYASKRSDKQIMCNLRDAFNRQFNTSSYFEPINRLEWGMESCRIDEEFVKNSEVILSYGGSSSKWVDKVNGETFLVYNNNNLEQELVRVDLWDLDILIKDENIRAQVQIAIRMYIMKAYLGELKNVYNYTNYQPTKEENASLVLVETRLKESDIRNLNQTDNLIEQLYNQFTVFADRKSCYSTLYDLYVSANMQLNFAKIACAANSKSKCVRFDIYAEQKEANDLFSLHENGDGKDCAEDVRTFKNRLKTYRENGLKAICIVCLG